jgi:hypothetical protein
VHCLSPCACLKRLLTPPALLLLCLFYSATFLFPPVDNFNAREYAKPTWINIPLAVPQSLLTPAIIIDLLSQNTQCGLVSENITLKQAVLIATG